MQQPHSGTFALLAALVVMPLAATAQEQKADQKAPNEQVIVPEVNRRAIKLPKFPSNDFEIGTFAGSYATKNFGTSLVYGVRLGYHITEDVFVQAVYGQTKVSDESFRQILPGGIFVNPTEKLSYYNVSAGLNVLPGEVFFLRNRAFPSSLYIIGGIGSTSFNAQRRQTFNVGFGAKVYLRDWVSLQVDMRDHIFSLDLLGKRQSTQNLEFTGGLSFYF
ncbi:MAG: outer membrane beta-barrel domain-containing protein [Burkholderiales bacterium]|nr:outer membrane beta-barrel domain-containing protein [Burkholderiales bacterium]